MAATLRWGAVYFATIFAIGFVLGPFRILLLEPVVGERVAELIEAPFMLTAIVLIARWRVASTRRRSLSPNYLAAGLFALALLIALEFGVVLAVRGLSVIEYWSGRDTVSGAVYLALLILFAVMPALFAHATRTAGPVHQNR